jgi:hypothetical protein
LLEKPLKRSIRLLPRHGGPSGASGKAPKQPRRPPADHARPENPLPNHAKPVRAPAARRKREYRVARGEQNHAKQPEVGENRHRHGSLGNDVAVANGISGSTRKSARQSRTRALSSVALHGVAEFGRCNESNSQCAHSVIFYKVPALAVTESIINENRPRYHLGRRTQYKLPTSFCAHALGFRNFTFLVLVLMAGALVLAGCDRHGSSMLSTSKITAANYDQIKLGMSKTQVESILGAPTTAETKDMVIFRKTTYRYEDGSRFILLTFKNEELDSKDSNLTTQ